MSSLIPWVAALWQQGPPQTVAQSNWSPLFWLWLAVTVILIALFILRVVMPRRRRPPIDPDLR